MRRIILALLILSIAGSSDVSAQGFLSKKKKAPAETKKEEKKEEDKFGDITKKCTKSDGLFPIWRDTTSGKMYLEVAQDQLNKEFIYFSFVADAPSEAGHFRGSYRGSKVIRFQRVFEKIEIIHENTGYYFDENNAISKAADANVNDPVMASEKIEAVSKDKKKYLIDGDAIFLSEKFSMIKFPSQGGSSGPLGNLSSSKTRVEEIKNYPENTDVKVAYVYENASPNMSSTALADARNITIRYQHSIIEMPVNNFKPRYDDPRIGYFSTQVNDMTSFSPTPYKDVIHRWHLEKKNPGAALSDPVEPITFWIENTTPLELRPIIKDACERWNEAFKTAGFTNAVVCKEQPDDATWDAGDIRYNVLRWTSTPAPPFGGYGPSFVNPRTGQIMGADIMLELVAIIGRVKAEKVFKSAGYMNDEELEQQLGVEIRNPFFCMAAEQTSHNVLFGTAAAEALGMDQVAEKEIVRQLLYRLVLHEVGHTLGLTHNMRASTMSTMADVKNPEKVSQFGLASTVMEYPAFNFQANPEQQTAYCDTKPGPYDHWVIEFGYSESMADPIGEEYRIKKILDRSVNHELAYGNDADDMRSSGRGIDPDVNIYDLTDDPVAYAAERCELVNTILPKLQTRFEKKNQSYEVLLQAYLVCTGEYATQLRIMSRQIGGVHYDRAYPGQGSLVKPLEPVSEAKQKAAMAALSKYAFAPDAFNKAQDQFNYLLSQRRGFNHFSNNPDPRIHTRILAMQEEVLNHLLHENVMQRITDSQLYGNKYTLDKVMTDLTNAIFSADASGNVNTMRQNLQVEYTQRLASMFDEKSKYDHVSKGFALSELKRIDKMMATGAGDALTKAHREHVRFVVKQVMEGKK